VTGSAELLHLGAVGIALGSAVGAWVEVLLLRMALRWRIGPVDLGGGALGTLVTVALAGAALGRLLGLVLPDLPPVLVAAATIGVAGITYLGLTTALGMPLRAMLGAGTGPRRP
jgi:peptidoglycan biosynthesis protein MviN/MurJ (putative lipid II flippase)